MTAERMPTGTTDLDTHKDKADTAEIEATHGEWQTKIILQRHADYDKRFPENGWINPTDEERENLGRLTEAGAEQAREVARERVAEAIAQAGPDVDFVVVASPTRWLGHPEFGQRAVETGKIISDEILRELQEAGLPETQLLNLTESIDGDFVRESSKIVEAQMFDNHMSFADELRAKYGGQNRDFWDAYNADADRERRKEVGAEGSPETADRVNELMNVLARWAKVRHTEEPHRKTVIFVVSHHEVIEPYAQHVVGTQPGEFEPKYNDGIEINIDSEGVGHTNIADRTIDVAFAAHGKLPSVDHE